MTEFWVSQKNHWCDICKVWMTDNAATRATHEKGVKHQELVAKKLREMRQKADAEKRQQALAEASLGSIEREAARQYARDKAAADKHQSSTIGSWEPDANSGYLYNAVHRYYYDKRTGMYYGGDPAAWTITPKMPTEALYAIPCDTSNAGVQPRTASPAAASAPAKGQPRKVVRVANSHPLSGVGGHAMPSTGTVGALKGVAGAATAANKRKREQSTEKQTSKKALTKEEEEAIAKREAARVRVQKRTMASFGLA